MNRATTGATEGRRPIALAVVALLVALALKVVWMRVQVLGSALPHEGLLRDWLFVALACAPALLVWRRRGARAALLAVALVLSVTMFGTTVYERYFDEVASLKVLRMSGQVGDVGGSVAELLSVADVLFFIDLPVLGWLMLRRRQGVPAPTPRWEVVRGALAAALAAAVVTSGVTAIVAMPGILNGVSIGRGRGVFSYQLASLFHTERLGSDINVDAALPAEVIATIAELKGTAPAERAHPEVPFGSAEGANIIVIQCEALQNLLIGAEVGGAPVTPSLNALAAESWYFPHMFSQIGGGNTSDAEWVSNTSLYPPTNEPASVRWEDRRVPSLPRVLGDAGYTSLTFHANDASFWNRRNLYAALGFDRYYDRDFFGNTDTIGFGVSDEYLFERTLDELVELDGRGQPFYAQIITVTAHHPFDPLPARKQPLQVPPPFAGTQVGDYVSNQEYADRAIGQFVTGLKESGLWEDSIVVIYGDHFGLRRLEPEGGERDAIETLLGRPYTALDRLNVPLIVHLPGQTEGVTSADTAALIDVAPTVLDALGLTADTMPMFGRSLFAGGPAFGGMQKYVVVGSYVSTDTVVIPGDEPGTAVVIPVADPLARPAASADQIGGLAIASELILLSGEYCDALPVRPDFVPDSKMDIPTRDDI